jgi:hypothetical protein
MARSASASRIEHGPSRFRTEAADLPQALAATQTGLTPTGDHEPTALDHLSQVSSVHLGTRAYEINALRLSQE